MHWNQVIGIKLFKGFDCLGNDVIRRRRQMPAPNHGVDLFNPCGFLDLTYRIDGHRRR